MQSFVLHPYVGINTPPFLLDFSSLTKNITVLILFINKVGSTLYTFHSSLGVLYLSAYLLFKIKATFLPVLGRVKIRVHSDYVGKSVLGKSCSYSSISIFLSFTNIQKTGNVADVACLSHPGLVCSLISIFPYSFCQKYFFLSIIFRFSVTA